jgi:hypothetical protein
MKKHLLLIAALFATASAFAQPTWTAVAYGTEKALVADAVAFTKGASITAGDVTFTAAGATDWLYKISDSEFTFNNKTYNQTYVQGQTNGKDGFVDGGTNSSLAIFKSKKSGKLDVTFKFGYNKRFYVAEFTDADLDEVDLASAEAVAPFAYNKGQYWRHYIDVATKEFYMPEVGADGKAIPRPDDAALSHYTGCTINVVAGKNYYVWFEGSKLMLVGFNFEAGTKADILSNDATVVSTEYFNVQGSKLAAPARGLNIVKQNMSDGSVKTFKKMVR